MMNADRGARRLFQPESRPGSPSAVLAVVALFAAVAVPACRPDRSAVLDRATLAAWSDTLSMRFDGRRGQVEVGGPYVGAEFHGSRPLPSRISFYYPVANSIDLSTGYWERAESRPFTATMVVGGDTTDLGDEPAAYTWAPHRVRFDGMRAGHQAMWSWGFAQDLPVMIFRLSVVNSESVAETIEVTTSLDATLRSSHRFAVHDRARSAYSDDHGTFTADFDLAGTDAAHVDSAQVFVMNVGAHPVANGGTPTDHPEAVFVYRMELQPGDSLNIIQLIGSAGARDAGGIRGRAARDWAASETALEEEIVRYVMKGPFDVPDAGLMRTARMARVLLQANRHYLDGSIVPMPCPAEYNFFFTHDLLLTDLGAVRFDTDRVRQDLLYLASLVDSTNVLPHARYWRDGAYVTEPTGEDNWNHLWAIVLSAAYLQHSGDTETVRTLYPVLSHSMATMRRNEMGGLMHAIRPDWWDIGHVYGGRAYLTSLMIRALEAYSYVSLRLGESPNDLEEHVALAARMRRTLVERLWDDDSGYLLNMLDSTRIDRHFYSGSLLAAAFDLLDDDRESRLIETAGRELLDPNLGIRNAMPPDFHELIDVYKFNGDEAGAPFLYMNGGIWTQGSAWYAQALLAAGRPDEARDALTRYLSLDGTLNSPNGQPAFFEYRNGDPGSPRYGEVDKPTFLWAGGWYLHVLYGLAGVRQNAWNVSFDPRLPTGFDSVEYDLMLGGADTRVKWTGTGTRFASIRIDGEPSYSAVMTGGAARIDLVRGRPTAPYLASATTIVERVEFDEARRMLAIDLVGVPGQQVDLVIVSPGAPGGPPERSATLDGGAMVAPLAVETDADGVATIRLSVTIEGGHASVWLKIQRYR